MQIFFFALNILINVINDLNIFVMITFVIVTIIKLFVVFHAKTIRHNNILIMKIIIVREIIIYENSHIRHELKKIIKEFFKF